MSRVFRPKLKVDISDKIIELLGVIGLIILIALPIFYYNSLPEIVPQHYGANGEPDGWGGKEKIWTLPIIGFLIYVGLAILNRFPNVFNYPKKITEENVVRQFRIATRMIRLLNTLIVYDFSYITYATIQTAFGKQNGLGNYFMPLFIISIFGTVGYSIYKLLKVK